MARCTTWLPRPRVRLRQATRVGEPEIGFRLGGLPKRRMAAAKRMLSAAREESFILPGRTERSRWIYPALAELVRRYAEGGDESRSLSAAVGLTGYEFRVFSQNGEDGVLAELFRRLRVTDGSFVEFGIQGGREGNCVFLADVLGWPGLFMEMDPNAYSALERKYRANPRVTTRQAQVTPDNVESLLAECGVPEEPTVMSIDVDGPDYWIWGAVSRFRPWVVVIEYNAALDPSQNLVQPADAPPGWTGTDRFGASLGALTSLAESMGYRLAHTELAGVNAFFVRSDLGADLPAPESVPMRAPNFFLAGHGHVRDPGEADWITPGPPNGDDAVS